MSRLIARTLPREEYPRLAGTELETVWPSLPASAHVVVVEDAGRIVACWSAFPVLHVEGLWTAPSHRGRPSVLFRLLAAMRRVLSEHGVGSVYTAACTDDVRALIGRFGGTKIPADAYLLPLGETRCQPQ